MGLSGPACLSFGLVLWHSDRILAPRSTFTVTLGDTTWLTIYLTLTVPIGIVRCAGIIKDELTESEPIGRSLSEFPSQPLQNPIRMVRPPATSHGVKDKRLILKG